MHLAPRDLTRPDVWAPHATRVDLVSEGERHQMSEQEQGWWTLPADVRLRVGQRYAYSLDGGQPRPDPRALLLPEGVHGPSEVVDPALFHDRPRWRGKSLAGQVSYELHVGTFTPQGTFDAAIGKLAHLVELGVDAVELMPVATFPGDRGWGYDGVGLYSVHPAYGGPAAMVRFIDAAHEAGLAVILDVVHNHLGPEGNHLAEFGPYFTDTHETPWGPAVNLDSDGAEQVRKFLIGSARQWIVDFGVDGLRLDAVHELIDDSEIHFLADLSVAVAEYEDEAGRPVALIAEADLNQPYMVSPIGSMDHARGMHAQWADDVHHAIHSFVTRETEGYYWDFQAIEMLQKALTRVFVHDGIYSTFRDKEWGAPVDPDIEHYDGHSFVVFMQNHDQIGNRPAGDRIGHTVDAGAQAAGAALYLLSAFTPMLFMGEEWDASTPFPFFSHLGAELGPLVSEGRAREFAAMGGNGEVPDPQAESTFSSAKLRWDELDNEPHSHMFRWYRDLLQLRRDEPEIADPDLHSVSVEIIDDDTVVMRRGRILVGVTRAADGATIPLGEHGQLLLAWEEPTVRGANYLLPGPGAVVVRTPAAD